LWKERNDEGNGRKENGRAMEGMEMRRGGEKKREGNGFFLG